jgi:hypothetical protein
MARGLTSQGAITGDVIQQISDGDALQAPPILLTGLADVINPHVSGNYIIKSTAADLMTLAAPTAGTDDNLSIAIYSDSLFAHTITTASLFANGAALAAVATFKAFKGSGLILRAFNGVWQVLASNVTSIT